MARSNAVLEYIDAMVEGERLKTKCVLDLAAPTNSLDNIQKLMRYKRRVAAEAQWEVEHLTRPINILQRMEKNSS